LLARVAFALVVLLPAREALAEGPALPAAPARFESSVRGAFVDAAIGTSAVGDSLLLELGARTQGIRSLSARRWLFSWDLALALRAGYLANQHPYLSLAGAHAWAFAEAGYRFQPSERGSPYLGLRLADEGQLLSHPGSTPPSFRTYNNVDGVGGALARGALRLDVGASFLESERSLLAVLFLEEVLQAAQVNVPGRSLTQLGVLARYDSRLGPSASLEGAYGFAPAQDSPALGLRDRTTRLSGSASVRWEFRSRNWLGLQASLARESDRLSYAGSPQTYRTANAPEFSALVMFGLALGKEARR
jgi:hypothetical protein